MSFSNSPLRSVHDPVVRQQIIDYAKSELFIQAFRNQVAKVLPVRDMPVDDLKDWSERFKDQAVAVLARLAAEPASVSDPAVDLTRKIAQQLQASPDVKAYKEAASLTVDILAIRDLTVVRYEGLTVRDQQRVVNDWTADLTSPTKGIIAFSAETFHSDPKALLALVQPELPTPQTPGLSLFR